MSSSSKRQRTIKDPISPFVYSSESSSESSSFESSSSESSGEADSKQNLVTILLKDIEKDEKLSNSLLKHHCALQKRIMKKGELLDELFH
ncbi:hypothetical protein Tco_0117375 [Tanacetum coccineum]